MSSWGDILGNILLAIYATGYFIFVFGAAIFYWPIAQSFWDWQIYVFFQTWYGLVWPILLILQLI
jgi:hypothetical protein